jgi:type III pantothenate kinase
MLLAVDVGNTQTHIGVFSGDDLYREWRASTDQARTADELALMFGHFLSLADLSFSRQITGVAISSVVPRVTQSSGR